MSDGAPGGGQLLELYDRALPQVYGYLFGRCRDAHLAEELTADTFLAAVETAGDHKGLTTAWLITVARNKLVDHWRREERENRRQLRLTDDELARASGEWDASLDSGRAEAVLARLRAPHRAVLTLRYVDGLSISEVAGIVDRTVHATEALIVRARAAFRRLYEEEEGDDTDA